MNEKGQFTVELAPFTLSVAPLGSVTPHHVRSFLEKDEKSCHLPQKCACQSELEDLLASIRD